jgi:hypothetical protein
MSFPNSPPLNLELRALRLSAYFSYLAIALGGLTPWMYLPPTAALGIGASAAALTYLGFRRARWIGGYPSVRRLAWESDGRWSVEGADGRKGECELHHSSRVFSKGVWLCLQSVGDPSVLQRLWVDRRRLRHPAELRSLIVRLRLDQAVTRPVLDAQG